MPVDRAGDYFTTMTTKPLPDSANFYRCVFPWNFSPPQLGSSAADLQPRRRRCRPRVFSDDDDEETVDTTPRSAATFSSNNLSQEERETLSRRCYAEICNLQASRETRDNQRWATITIRNPCGSPKMILRLVTGCIPILSDGCILLIGSSSSTGRKKKQFLGLPKGGWETDECLEKGAMRETFEEAGVLGILGAPLPSFLSKKKSKSKTTASGGDDESKPM
ncbi:MAG: hypothetical protein SGILL_009867 [Bacillariaceae sp.]